MTKSKIEFMLNNVLTLRSEYILAYQQREDIMRLQPGIIYPNNFAEIDGIVHKAYNDYMEVYIKAEELINTLPEKTTREILKRKYLLGENWEEISKSTAYSERHLMRLKKKAIEFLSDK